MCANVSGATGAPALVVTRTSDWVASIQNVSSSKTTSKDNFVCKTLASVRKKTKAHMANLFLTKFAKKAAVVVPDVPQIAPAAPVRPEKPMRASTVSTTETTEILIGPPQLSATPGQTVVPPKAAHVSPPMFQDESVKRIEAYLTGPSASAVLCLTGPSGCGKTYLIDFVAQKLGLAVNTWHGDDDDFEELFKRPLAGRRIVVLDEIAEAVDLARVLRVRGIITTTDPYDGAMRSLRKKVDLLYMRAYTASNVATIVSTLCNTSYDIGLTVAAQCGQDVRYGITMLRFAIQTKRAKREGHKSILTSHDAHFSLFRDVSDAFGGQPRTGIQSADMFLYTTMMQANLPDRTSSIARLAKAEDAFAHIDVLDIEVPTENVLDLVHICIGACTVPVRTQLQMPKMPSRGSRETVLRTAAGSLTLDAIQNFERIAAFDMPDRLTASSQYYHADAEVRAARKRPWK
jgi:DNA polymerase III delta prime subunit